MLGFAEYFAKSLKVIRNERLSDMDTGFYPLWDSKMTISFLAE